MANVYSVSQVNAYIKNMFAQDFALNRISVKGEVSNCKYHTSGHIYFTLKDRGGSIAAVMFAGQRRGLNFSMADGQQVVVSGTVDVYERDGKYQLYAREITLGGIGDLYEKFRRLRDELEEMGMFSAEYKKPIPRYARTIGIVTAPTGAAVRDIMNIAARRNPYVQLILYPALVQGEGAKASIVKGLETLDRMGLDVIIAGRGGGSIEDLWAFNEEEVARAIFACRTPVISAVGHETDVTIADYVADMRAPTPSAAAELAVFDYRQFQEQTDYYRGMVSRAMGRQLERARNRTKQLELQLNLYHPGRRIREQKMRAAGLQERLQSLMEQKLTDSRYRLALLSHRLEGQSPLGKIGNGFGFVTDGSGRRAVTAASFRPGDRVKVVLPDGRLTAVVEDVEPEVLHGLTAEKEDHIG